jgi:hypothetical protein
MARLGFVLVALPGVALLPPYVQSLPLLPRLPRLLVSCSLNAQSRPCSVWGQWMQARLCVLVPELG